MIYYYTVDYILTGNVFTDTIADLLLHPYAESSYARHYTCKKKTLSDIKFMTSSRKTVRGMLNRMCCTCAHGDTAAL